MIKKENKSHTKEETIGVKVTKGTRDSIDEFATKIGVKRSEVMREALDRGLEDMAKEISKASI